MAPGVSSNDTSPNLEKTIAEIYKTLRRTENRTLETKRKAAKTLEDSSSHLTISRVSQAHKNSDRFSESFSNSQIKEGQDAQSTTTHHRYSTEGSIIEPEKRAGPRRTTTAITKEQTKKTPDNNDNKLRAIIFKTLDRLFQFPSSSFPSNSGKQPKLLDTRSQYNVENSPLSFETLKLLNQNTTDTLSRNDSYSCKDDILLPQSEITTAHELECSYTESSSSDDSCWEFIIPLKFVDAEVDDTLTTTKIDKKIESNSRQKVKHQVSKIHYQRKVKQSKEKSRIQKRALERQTEKTKSDLAGRIGYYVRADAGENFAKAVKRPDSPLERKTVNGKQPQSMLVPLPNLKEAIQEIDSNSADILSDCGTETFKRNISYCPSSTLSKSIPSFAANHENDDDACSTSSSFSSLQRVHSGSDITSRSTHESTLPVPSALCNDVLIHPINVPIQPFAKHQESGTGITTGITPQSFKELAEVYKPTISNETAIKSTQPVVQHSYENEVTNYNDALPGFETVTLSSSVTDATPQNTSLNKVSVDLIIPHTPPAPPPMPPPPPPLAQNTTIKRCLLPLLVFTQRQTGNCIFNDMKDIKIDEGDAKKLKEQFPLKSNCKASKRLMGKGNKSHELSQEENKFLHNIERFLRTYRIVKEDVIFNIGRSISALDAANSMVETEWFTGLAQSLPKEEELIKMAKHKSFLSSSVCKTDAGKLVSQLLNISHLHKKLKCIQFSLDFEDGSSKVARWTESFIAACEAITSSDKFVSIINVIMGLLDSLNSDEQSKIYGFDIQSLTKLTNVTSEDGSSTLLHFVIEYILDKPDLTASVDFYKSFNDFPDVTKTSIDDMKKECNKWRKCMKEYEAQVDQIKSNSQICSLELGHAQTFMKNSNEKLKSLNDKLNAAQLSFNGCKEHFGLMNFETNEVTFFDSLSKFVSAYQKTYEAIIFQREKIDKQNVANNANKRASMTLQQQQKPTTKFETASSDCMVARRKSYSGLEFQSIIATENGFMKKSSQNGNPRRKSLTPRGFQDIVDTPETAEVGESLHKLLTNDDPCNKRVRKRVSKSPSSKIPAISK